MEPVLGQCFVRDSCVCVGVRLFVGVCVSSVCLLGGCFGVVFVCFAYLLPLLFVLAILHRPSCYSCFILIARALVPALALTVACHDLRALYVRMTASRGAFVR